MKTIVFCDFDGTITKRDVGYNMFHHFSDGKNDLLLPDWKSGKISSRECLTKEAELVIAPASEILSYIDTFDIDPNFPSFVELCRKSDIEIVIVSDGLDFYIKHILTKNNLIHLPVVCNIGKLNSSGIKIEFPRNNRSCIRCGSCKGEIIEEYCERTGESCRTVFVGDGYSDTCATRVADLLFAKKDLERYCLKNNISYTTFNTFGDVARVLIERGYIKP